jgi:endonuclease YncB( thermonuclease family)
VLDEIFVEEKNINLEIIKQGLAEVYRVFEKSNKINITVL